MTHDTNIGKYNNIGTDDDVRFVFDEKIKENVNDLSNKSNKEAITGYTTHIHDGTFSKINARNIERNDVYTFTKNNIFYGMFLQLNGTDARKENNDDDEKVNKKFTIWDGLLWGKTEDDSWDSTFFYFIHDQQENNDH